ncbi:MAG TPA: GGDEF domain-containing protein [Solirubrobacteraceae bacterium]|jgi:diguanylate cyclase (GGDEF)-like protein/PAS domain S-box-containing protein
MRDDLTESELPAAPAPPPALPHPELTARTVLDALQEGVVVVDAAGVVARVNEAVSRLCRADARGLVGHPITQLPVAMVRDPAGEPLRLEEAPLTRALRGEVVRGHLSEIERLDGTRAWIEVNSNPLVGPETAVPYGAVSTYVDVTERVERERRFRHEADHDPLTGVANRRRLVRTLDAAVARARRHEHGVAALAVDLDGFKAVNDRHGHAAGDEVLREVARRLVGAVRERDLVSRPGGDEFVLLLVDLGGPAGMAERLRDRVERVLQEPIQVGEDRIALEAAVGLACFPADAADAAGLLRAADAAMYARKRAA